MLVHVACRRSGLRKWLLSVLCMGWTASMWAHDAIVLAKTHKQNVVIVKAQVTTSYSG